MLVLFHSLCTKKIPTSLKTVLNWLNCDAVENYIEFGPVNKLLCYVFMSITELQIKYQKKYSFMLFARYIMFRGSKYVFTREKVRLVDLNSMTRYNKDSIRVLAAQGKILVFFNTLSKIFQYILEWFPTTANISTNFQNYYYKYSCETYAQSAPITAATAVPVASLFSFCLFLTWLWNRLQVVGLHFIAFTYTEMLKL